MSVTFPHPNPGGRRELHLLLSEPEGDVLPRDVPGDGAAEGPLRAAAQAQEPRHRRLQDR